MQKQTYRLLIAQLAVCSKYIEKKMKMPPVSEWQNAHYITLSEAVTKETKIQISKNTLKRIFGKMKTDEHYYPQKATLDAIALFIGFDDWEAFTIDSLISEAANPLEAEKTEVVKERSAKTGKLGLKIIAVLVMLILIGFFFWGISFINRVPSARIIAVNPIGIKSHSAIFKLKAPDVPEGLMVDFSDNMVKIPVRPSDEDIIHFYPVPGWYRSVLSFKGTNIDSAVVKVLSSGWVAYVSPPRGYYGVHLLKGFDGTVKGMKGFRKRDAVVAGADSLRPVFINYVNMKNTRIDGNNLEMKSVLRIAERNINASCSTVHLFLYGEKEFHMIGIANPECVAWSDLKFSDNVVTGLYRDLRLTGFDLAKKMHIVLRVLNKDVKLYIGGKMIYRTSYKKSLGKISGVRLLFNGYGEVYSFSLKDLKTGEVF